MNKKILILFVCIALVVITVVTCAVTFTVRKIIVLAPIDQESKFDMSKIVADSKIKIGSSIFALSEEVAAANIEKLNPYSKVITIERVFPSSIHINLVYRAPILALPLDSNSVMLLDRELKLLEVVDKSAINSQNLAIIRGLSVDGITAEHVGLFIDKQERGQELFDTILAIENVGILNEFIKVFVKEFDMSSASYIVVRTKKGANIAISTTLDFKNQFLLLFSAFESMKDNTDTSKYIYLNKDTQHVTIDTSLPA